MEYSLMIQDGQNINQQQLKRIDYDTRKSKRFTRKKNL